MINTKGNNPRCLFGEIWTGMYLPRTSAVCNDFCLFFKQCLGDHSFAQIFYSRMGGEVYTSNNNIVESCWIDPFQCSFNSPFVFLYFAGREYKSRLFNP